MPNDIKNKKVLEIGCGLGAHTEVLAQKKANLTSIDLASTSIKVTKKRLKIKNLKANVLECDAEKLPFPNNSLILFGVGVLFNIVPTQKNVQKKLHVF